MKKILIVNNNMHIGGIQKSLVNLLGEIKNRYDVTLLLLCDIGELRGSIPAGVRVIGAGAALRTLGMTHAEAKMDGALTFLVRSVLVVLTRLFTTRLTFALLTKSFRAPGEYDAAISYMQNDDKRIFYGGCAELVLNSVKSREKICFVHSDFKSFAGNNAYNIGILNKFDKIAAVSDSAAERLIMAAPGLAGKVRTVHNCINYDEIARLKDEYSPQLSGGVKLFTAARLHHEKGILRMLPVLKRIKEAGADFVWYVAGDGPDKAEAVRLISEYGLGREVVLLGNLVNPYPYFYRADILLVPSYEEAAPMVFGEAEALGTYIFSTRTASAEELVSGRGIGTVCENTDDAIERELLKVIENFSPHKYAASKADNSRCVAEFDALIGRE